MLLGLLAAVFVGASLGLLGGGGTVLLVPVLVHGMKLDARAAIATSLVVVAVTSLVAAVSHARAGRLAWRAALSFAPASVVGALLGSRLADHVPHRFLLGLLAVVMLVAAIAMRGATAAGGAKARPLRLLAAGLATGALTGLVGAGGGFLVVPALAVLGGLDPARAMATSPAILAVTALVALTGHAGAAPLDWPLIAAITLLAAASALVATRFADRIPRNRLRQAFAALLVIVGASELIALVPGGPRPFLAATWPLLALAASLAAGLWALRRDRAVQARNLGGRP